LEVYTYNSPINIESKERDIDGIITSDTLPKNLTDGSGNSLAVIEQDSCPRFNPDYLATESRRIESLPQLILLLLDASMPLVSTILLVIKLCLIILRNIWNKSNDWNI